MILEPQDELIISVPPRNEEEQQTVIELQYLFNSKPQANEKFEIDDRVLDIWEKLGPLNVEKMIDEGYLMLKYMHKDQSKVLPLTYNHFWESEIGM